MNLDSQNIKELLEKGANLIIDDDLPVEELRYIVELAFMNEKNITIVAKRWHLEALKKIALDGKGYVTIDIREVKKRT